MNGQYSCWCCSIYGTLSESGDPFGGSGGIKPVPAPPPAPGGEEGEAGNSVAAKVPKVKKDLKFSALPAWVWIFSFLLPVVYVVISKVLTRGLPASKTYASPGGLTYMRALRCKGLSWLTLCQMLSGYLEPVEKPDGSAIWKRTTWFGGLAKGHDLLGICYGDSDELSKRCRVAMMVFSVLLASALSIAFGSTQLQAESDCRYECHMTPRNTNPIYGSSGGSPGGSPGLECKLDTFFRDDDGPIDGWGNNDDDNQFELPSDYLSSTGLFILLINQLCKPHGGLLNPDYSRFHTGLLLTRLSPALDRRHCHRDAPQGGHPKGAVPQRRRERRRHLADGRRRPRYGNRCFGCRVLVPAESWLVPGRAQGYKERGRHGALG